MNVVKTMDAEVTRLISQASDRAPARWRPRNALLRIRAFLLLVTSDAVAIVFGFVAFASLRGALMPDQTWLVMLLALVPVWMRRTGAWLRTGSRWTGSARPCRSRR